MYSNDLDEKMNFLAHIYLSGNSNEIRLGNFIADYVKGAEHTRYPTLVQRGILLHRKIDYFTDTHPIVKQHKLLFQPKYRKHAGVVTDIVYDHFLASEWHHFSDTPFDDYVDQVHDWLNDYMDSIPLEMRKIMPGFIRNNWLRSYKTLEGIESVLIGMSKGTSMPPENTFAIYVMHKNYQNLKKDFFAYFELLCEYSQKELGRMEMEGNRS